MPSSLERERREKGERHAREMETKHLQYFFDYRNDHDGCGL